MTAARGRRAHAWVGTSGYDYDDWQDVLYPRESPRNRRLLHYVDDFATVEINATFYGLPSEGAVASWREAAPGGFLFAVKFSRYGSHLKHLKDPADTIATFLERA